MYNQSKTTPLAFENSSYFWKHNFQLAPLLTAEACPDEELVLCCAAGDKVAVELLHCATGWEP